MKRPTLKGPAAPSCGTTNVKVADLQEERKPNTNEKLAAWLARRRRYGSRRA